MNFLTTQLKKETNKNNLAKLKSTTRNKTDTKRKHPHIIVKRARLSSVYQSIHLSVYPSICVAQIIIGKFDFPFSYTIGKIAGGKVV